jgi:hypothetical protein
MEHFQQNSVHATEHAAAYKKLLTVLIVWWSESTVLNILHPNTIVCYLYMLLCCIKL